MDDFGKKYVKKLLMPEMLKLAKLPLFMPVTNTITNFLKILKE